MTHIVITFEGDKYEFIEASKKNLLDEIWLH